MVFAVFPVYLSFAFPLLAILFTFRTGRKDIMDFNFSEMPLFDMII